MTQKSSKPTIEIRLTSEQQKQVRQATGRAVSTLKLEALEARLAPGMALN